MNSDPQYMRRCIELAGLGAGYTAPNPMVGAVLVCENKIVGEGYHQVYGEAHAEVNCIKDADRRYGPDKAAVLLHNSTLYVSLEPCAHFGKTPPAPILSLREEFLKWSLVVSIRLNR